MYTATQNLATVGIIFEESSSSSFSFINKYNIDISCHIKTQRDIKGNQMFYFKFKKWHSSTNHTHVVRTVAPEAGADATGRPHQPQMDRRDQTM